MRNLRKFVFSGMLMLNAFCTSAFAYVEKSVALPEDVNTRKLIVNLVVIAVGLVSYYFTKFIMYHVGDVRANIDSYMVRKNYRKVNSNRDKYKKMNYDMQNMRRMREQMMQQQNLSNEEMQRQMEEMQRQMEDSQRQMEEMQRQQNEWATEEARKAVTPFDHGGYMQGDGFNPSDTMAADAQRQMDNMNNMNNMGMF